MSRPSSQFRKEAQQDKNYVDRSKFKCFNCAISRNLSNECRKPKDEKKRRTNDGIDYKKKYYKIRHKKDII